MAKPVVRSLSADEFLVRLRQTLAEPPTFGESTDNLELELARAVIRAVGLEVQPAPPEDEAFAIVRDPRHAFGLAFCVRHRNPDRWDVFDAGTDGHSDR